MLGWFKKKLEARERAIIEKDKQARIFFDEAIGIINKRQEFQSQAAEVLEQIHIDIRDSLDNLERRRADLAAYKLHLDERADILDKMQKDIDHEKESMVGKDNLEIKREILLPIMKQKWEAEAKLLDSQRAEILHKTPKIYTSLSSRKAEYEAQIKIVKSKPSNMSNQAIMTEWQSRLNEVNEIIEIIDKERTKNAEDNPIMHVPV